MFNQLDIQGFKSFEYASLSLHPLTILTGLNSSGKSTVIQAIRMLAQGMKGKDNCLLDGYGDWNELKCNHSNSSFNTKWGLVVDDGYSHFFHQEAGIHVLRNSISELVGESQFVVSDVRFETIVVDIFGE